MAKVRAVNIVSIERIFVPGQWLSSLSRLISSMLMMLLGRECNIYLFFRFSSGSFSFTPPWRLIPFLGVCKFVVVSSCGFDKIDEFFVAWLITT
jgi:hypothetical protein